MARHTDESIALTFGQIGRRLGTNKGTVFKIYKRAMRKLRKHPAVLRRLRDLRDAREVRE